MFRQRMKMSIKNAARDVESGLVSPEATHFAGELFFRLLGRRRNGAALDLSWAKSVLVVRLDEIGDVVMTAPFLRELRRNLKEAWITLVVSPAVFNLVERWPVVNEVLVYDGRASGRFGLLRRHGRALRLAGRRLMGRKFDLAISPRWGADHYNAAVLAYFSGATRRVGYAEPGVAGRKDLDAGLDILYTQVLDRNGVKHEVERSLDVIVALNGEVKNKELELWPQGRDEARTGMMLIERDVKTDDLLVALCPSGGNSVLKKWPTDRFIELARWLQTEHDARIVLVGGPRDLPLGRQMQTALGRSVINCVGMTSLRQAGAVIKQCALYVGGDTGLMHLAAASGTPVVALFGSSCAHQFGPWGGAHRIVSSTLPCSPCLQVGHKDRCGKCIHDRLLCMLGITVDQVKTAVQECMESIKTSGRVGLSIWAGKSGAR